MEELKKTLNSEAGKVLRAFLIAELAELKNIENVNESIEDLIGQKKAYQAVKKMLDKIMTFDDEEVDKSLDDYSVGL